MQALDTIRGKDIVLLMDSHLEGNFSAEEANAVFGLASKCLQYEPRDRPTRKDLVQELAPLQNKPNVSHLLSFPSIIILLTAFLFSCMLKSLSLSLCACACELEEEYK